MEDEETKKRIENMLKEDELQRWIEINKTLDRISYEIDQLTLSDGKTIVYCNKCGQLLTQDVLRTKDKCPSCKAEMKRESYGM